MEFFILLTLFATLLSFSAQVISPTKIYVLCKQPTAVLNQDNVPVPQHDLCSHAASVHDASSHAALVERRWQVDASNVIGDANAPQGQTRARTHHSPQLAATAPPTSATQIYAAPSVLARNDYRGWTLCMHVPAHAELGLLSDIQLGRALVHHQYMPELPAKYFQHPNTVFSTPQHS